jgi:rhodanese-related sulfurtransferase
MKHQFKSITKEELQEMIETGEDFYLVNVLNEKNFAEAHIPGSLNIPLHSNDFEKVFKRLIPHIDAKIVVYCWSFECQTGPNAAKKLVELGYTNICDYSGGVMDWKEADLPLNEHHLEHVHTHIHMH